MHHKKPFLKKLTEELRSAFIASIVYVVVLFIAYIVGAINALAGAWLSILVIVGNLAYLIKISKGTRHSTLQQLLPALATWIMAFLLQQWVDYAFGLISLAMLVGRFVDLSWRPLARPRSHRTKLGSRRVGPAAKRGRSAGQRFTRRM